MTIRHLREEESRSLSAIVGTRGVALIFKLPRKLRIRRVGSERVYIAGGKRLLHIRTRALRNRRLVTRAVAPVDVAAPRRVASVRNER